VLVWFALVSHFSLVPGNCAGKQRLAHCYEMGIGCKKDPSRALHILEQLSESCTDTHTTFPLAMLYQSGVVPESRAMQLFRYIVEEDDHEHIGAWFQMGVLHWAGKGVPRQ
jgi:TPR repeat protein